MSYFDIINPYGGQIMSLYDAKNPENRKEVIDMLKKSLKVQRV